MFHPPWKTEENLVPPPSRTSEGLGSAKSREGDNLVVPPTIATDSVEDSSLQPVFFSDMDCQVHCKII